MSDTSPLVSVIVPVYNGERHLADCIQSIRQQTYTNMEIILVNDGSTDNSLSMCREMAQQDARIRVIDKPNGGIGSAQNAGLDAAHGDFIAFADNDDILDAKNIEMLLHALLAADADMSKGRWMQFGESQWDEIFAVASLGADNPESTVSFADPLRTYQTVFCKSLRLIGQRCGKHTEAAYFNEANWCRLYRTSLWEGVRFPEGRYAQDVMVAGELYSRMRRVTDVNVVLYYWLQSTGSVTHVQKSVSFYHDNVEAGIVNFQYALDRGITPARSFYTMREELMQAHKALQRNPNDNDAAVYQHDVQAVREQCGKLSILQHAHCAALAALRYAEKLVYDRKIKNLQ